MMVYDKRKVSEMAYGFFAILARMRDVRRWSLMHNTSTENLSEHTLETCYLTHLLITLHNKRFGGQLDAGKGALYAMYHDCTEILTGDLPTPVKYHSPELRRAYGELEHQAEERLLAMLPEDLQEEYAPQFSPEPEYYPYLKAADRLSALIKCVEERRQGNDEFRSAEASTRRLLDEMHLPEVDVFLEEFLPAYLLTLDELSNPQKTP